MTLTYTNAQTSLDLLWGTVDLESGRNHLAIGNSFSIDGNLIFTAAQNFCGSHSCPALSAGNDEVYLSITGLDPFNTVTFSDNGANGFEFLPARAPSALGGIPEPSTWAMIILGFAGIGFMAYRRQSKPTMNGCLAF